MRNLKRFHSHLIEIVDDVFFIASRLREIDDSYRVFYNAVKHRFEVHSLAQGADSLAVVLPFDRLDVRAVEFVRKTRIENYERIIKEIDENNRKLGGSYFACGGGMLESKKIAHTPVPVCYF